MYELAIKWNGSKRSQAEQILEYFPTSIDTYGVHHVGIYIGDGQFIHAPYTGDVVKITALSERGDYYCARRIIE